MFPTRNAVLLWSSLVAIGLALGAAPTGASARTAPFEWAAASGPVAGYSVYLSVDGGPDEHHGYVSQPSVMVEVESGAEVVISVEAFDAYGRRGPRSDPSPPLRLCPGDFDGDELIESADLSFARSCVLQEAAGACAGADIDENGSVTIHEVLGLEEGTDACRLAGLDSCAGDVDGDGSITVRDFSATKLCIGLYALGSCSDADYDGNGFISASDAILTGRQMGTTCSN